MVPIQKLHVLVGHSICILFPDVPFLKQKQQHDTMLRVLEVPQTLFPDLEMLIEFSLTVRDIVYYRLPLIEVNSSKILYSCFLQFLKCVPFFPPSRFLPALLTAVLTNHLAWVPTVMPNGQPPIRIFLEKHSSQTVDLLAKSHPYNPLWAQLGMF